MPSKKRKERGKRILKRIQLFRYMYDGKWHGKYELENVLGQEDCTKRIRELDTARYGFITHFQIPTRDTLFDPLKVGPTMYCLDMEQFDDPIKQFARDKMLIYGEVPFPERPMTKGKHPTPAVNKDTVMFRLKDLCYIYLMMTGNAILSNPEVAARFAARRDYILLVLSRVIPEQAKIAQLLTYDPMAADGNREVSVSIVPDMDEDVDDG